MSRIRADRVVNRAASGSVELSEGATIPAGKSLSGAGSINISGIATVSDIDINRLDVPSLNVTGISTFNSVGAAELNITGISTFNSVGAAELNITGISTFSGEQRVSTISEQSVIRTGNTATIDYSSDANIAICTTPTSDITLSINNIPTDSSFDNHNLTFAAVVASPGVARTVTSVNLNGVSKTVLWSGGSLSNAIAGVAVTTGYTIQSFTGINTVGSASTTDNYTVFGVVSGGFF